MADLMRNNGPSESSSAEGSAAVRASPQGAEPTAVRGNGAENNAAERGSQQEAEPTAAARQIAAAGAATAGGGAQGYSTAARETTFREEASRSVEVTGRRGAAVPVEVGPARGQADQPRGAGEWGLYPGGELGVGYDMPLPRLALKHTAVPQFSGKKPEFTAWTRDDRYYAKGVGFLICVCVGSTPVRSRRGIGYRKLGTCRKGVQPRTCTHTCTRVEFPIDGPEEQKRQEYLAQVNLA